MTLLRPGGTVPSLIVNIPGKAGVRIPEELAGHFAAALFTGLICDQRQNAAGQ